MPVMPPDYIRKVLEASAVKYEVPVTLLMAVAFVESSFRPEVVGPKVAAGWTAKGLMQLGPDIIKQFAVSDPMDAQQNADGGAAFLAERGKQYDWNVDRMLASYVWGPGKLADAEKIRKTAPAEVREYVRRVKAARYYYEDQAEPEGVVVFDQLAVAVDALRALNPQWQPALVLADNWQRTAADYTLDGLRKRWAEYSAAFERAPLTDRTTPAPYKMEPDQWMQAVRTLRKVTGKVRDIVAPAPQPQQQPLDFGVPIDGSKLPPVAYVAMGLFALLLLRRPVRGRY